MFTAGKSSDTDRIQHIARLVKGGVGSNIAGNANGPGVEPEPFDREMREPRTRGVIRDVAPAFYPSVSSRATARSGRSCPARW